MMLITDKLWAQSFIDKCLDQNLTLSVAVDQIEALMLVFQKSVARKHLLSLSKDDMNAAISRLRDVMSDSLHGPVLDIWLASLRYKNHFTILKKVVARVKIACDTVVVVKSAKLLASQEIDKIVSTMQCLLPNDVKLKIVIDNRILAGIILSWKSYKLDMSLANELTHLSKLLKNV